MKMRLDDRGQWRWIAENVREEAGWMPLAHDKDREVYLLPVRGRQGEALAISIPPIRGANK